VKKDNNGVKKCTKYEVEGTRPKGRPKKTWREIVEKGPLNVRACVRACLVLAKQETSCENVSKMTYFVLSGTLNISSIN